MSMLYDFVCRKNLRKKKKTKKDPDLLVVAVQFYAQRFHASISVISVRVLRIDKLIKMCRYKLQL